MSQSEIFDLVDPFEGYSTMSLNPRTFRDSTNAEKSSDLESIHQHMSSMVLRSPHKHLEKAKLVIDGNSKLSNTKENKNANTNDKENVQGRRPALARKRAQFSMIKDTSQPSTTLEPSFDFDKLQNPEDFFAAYDEFENAKKEMKRQRGEEDINEVTTSIGARPRRPEISRRKVNYKHYDYSTNSESTILSSHEISQDDKWDPPTQDSVKENVIPNNSQNEKSAGSGMKNHNELFDELISSDIHKLDEKEALSFLKNRLNIKSVELKDLKLPDIRRPSFISLGNNNLLKDKNRLSGTSTLSDWLITKTVEKQRGPPETEIPLNSPTPPRVPLLEKDKVIKNSSQKSSGKEMRELFSTRFKEAEIGLKDHQPCDNMEEREGNVEDIVPMAASYAHVNSNIEVEDIVPMAASYAHVNINMEVSDIEENVEDENQNQSSKLPESNTEVNNEEYTSQLDDISAMDEAAITTKEIPNISPPKQHEQPKRKKKNIVDLRKRRQSLSDAGTCWKSGVRRSQRVRSRPLEYWKGERFLYGRIHDSLPTVIGLKYMAEEASKNGENGGFKVESFVSNKHKDLVDLVALH